MHRFRRVSERLAPMAFDVKVPSVGESVQEGMIHQWHVEEGAFIDVDEVLVELETDKATVEIVAEKAGVVKRLKGEGDVVAIGDTIASIDTSAKAPAGGAEENTGSEPTSTQKTNGAATKATGSSSAAGVLSPAARKLAEEHGLDPATIQGTGPKGNILKEDVLKAASTQQSKAPAAKPASGSPKKKATSAPAFQAITGSRDIRREKMSMMRRTIARHLVKSQQTAAMLTTFNEVDMTAIFALRKKYKESFKEKYGVGLGFMGFFLKASVEALKEFPMINAYVDGEEIIHHTYCDVGVAVSSNRGLLVPVIRNVENMTIQNIESAIGDIATRARAGKIALDELSGGTFTVSNGGVFGSLMSTPILNSPQSAILGMHKIEKRAVVIDDQIVARPMMYLALSYDHRIVDGKEAVQFLVKIKDGLEDPSRLLLGI